MSRNKYTKPIIFIIGLVLFNIYAYIEAGNNSEVTFLILIVSIFFGLYKGMNASEFREVFNLYRANNIFKGPMRALELVAAMLLCISTNHASYRILNIMSLSNIMFEIIYFVVFTFVIYRFLFFNLFESKEEE
ncbi:hypothetical protein GCM10022410_22250 [Amphibacillus indicireducens]|uniref:Uncharacterized protein n=1 Tax=Amphibacillus indicireducens TaxID=1076330 RepID=A0ABP7VYU4_9BACI